MTAFVRDETISEVESKQFIGLAMRGHDATEYEELARMNKALIEDEKSRNPMSVDDLRARFARFVADEGWIVEVFTLEKRVVGFITYRYEPDPVAPDGRSVYLRQFYIARDQRRRGLGIAAVDLFKSARLHAGERVVLEVLESNPGGRAFWQRAGFVPYAAIMECTV